MFKLVVLSVCVVLTAGTPSGLLETRTIAFAHTPIVKNALFSQPTTIQVQQPYLAKVGEIVRSAPSAISHQSSTVVHNRINTVDPILAKGVRTISAPAIRTYTARVVSGYASTPIVKSAQYAAAPAIVRSYAVPSSVVKNVQYAALPTLDRSYTAPLLTTQTAVLVNPFVGAAGRITYRTVPAIRSYGSTVGAPIIKSHNTLLLRSW